MKKKNLVYIIGISFMLLTVAYVVFYFNRKGSGNAFERKIVDRELQFVAEMRLPAKYMYFAGTTDSGIYFKNLYKPKLLTVVGYRFVKTATTDLKLPGKDADWQFTIKVQDSITTVVSKRNGAVSLFSKNGPDENYKGPGILMDQARLISSHTMVGKSVVMEKGALKRQLTKVDFKTAEILKDYPLKKQVDGFFCTDGVLQYDAASQRIFYLYFYRGTFLCLDTNLNLLYESKTIDTVRTAVLKVDSLTEGEGKKKRNKVTQSAPAKVVNRNFIVYQGQIYVTASLQADNEKPTDFKNNQVIDVYAVADGNYEYSFYIPKHKGKKLREFRIIKTYLFATYEDLLIKYKIKGI